MKIKNKSDYVIAAVVVVCSIILLGALALALTDLTFGAIGRTVEVDFDSVTGIRVHSQVRYAGAPAGEVAKIRVLSLKEKDSLANKANNVRVTLSINKDIPPITVGTKVTVEADTLLSEKFLNLDPPADDSPELPKGAILQGKTAASLDTLASSAVELSDMVKKFMKELTEKHPDLPDKIYALVDNGNSLVVNADSLAKRADELAKHANSMLGENQANLQNSVANLRVIAENLKVVSTYAKSLTATLAQTPWRLIWGGKTPPLPPEEEILKSKKSIPIEPVQK